jgi:hypothetical protein
MTTTTAAVAVLALSILNACAGPPPPGASPPPAASPTPTPAPVRPLSDKGFVVRWGVPGVPQAVAAGERFAAAVIVENAGDDVWLDPRSAHASGSGAGAVRLSYRWLGSSTAETPMAEYATRADLAKPLHPRASTVMALEVVAPATPGTYRLQLDLCQELVSWFELKGADKLIVPVSVR